ncbi:MAG: glycosyltransferase 87 family protein [Deltaproteobacteria bacterium]|nr:glycosyltransferase 87 family protein [Deltaproteobacteria bacterium]
MASPTRATTWLARLGVATAVIVTLGWVHLAEFNGATLWDSAVFLAGGRLLQRGLMLYREVWDNKPPGIYLYQQAVYAVLPTAVWSLRCTDALLYLGGAAALYALCRRVARRPLALAATLGWLFVAHHPEFNVAGFYTEEYVAIFAAVAVALAARWAARGGGLWQPVLCGVAAALAVQFKTPGLACVVPALLLLGARRPRVAVAGFAAGAALPTLAVLVYLWAGNALPDYLDSQLWHAIASHQLDTIPQSLDQRLAQLGWETARVLGPYPWLIFPAMLGAALTLVEPTRLRVAALAWALADLAMIAAQKFYHAHYFIQVFPALTWLAAIGLAAALQRRPDEGWRRGAWRLGLTALLVGLAWRDAQVAVAVRQGIVARNWMALRAGPAAWRSGPGDAYEARVGAWVAARTAPQDTIFIHDTGSASAVYWTADRLPASRYLAENVVRGPRIAEQLGELERARPAYVLVAGGPGPRSITPLLERDYVLVGTRQESYRLELWGRRRALPLALGRFDAEGWTSPVVEANDEDGAVVLACGAEPVDGVRLAMRSAASAAATADAVWTSVAPGDTPVQQYVQLRCMLPAGAALRDARIGRLQFSPQGTDSGPLRTS